MDTESLVPQEHLLRKVDKAVDFRKLYEIVEPLYGEEAGRSSVDPAAVFIDGAHIKASANLNRNIKQEVAAAKRYRDELLAEINADREAHTAFTRQMNTARGLYGPQPAIPKRSRGQLRTAIPGGTGAS